jgi:ABC-type lipoprotein release transport system permease subunit
VFLVRNPGRSIPLGFVLMLAVVTIAGVVALLNSIDRTILKIYDYSRFFGAITPRGSEQLDPRLKQIVQHAPGLERVYTTSVCATNVQTIVGKMPFVLFGLKQDEMRFLATRCRLTLGEGRWPYPGQPEAILSEPVARNKKVKVGDVILSPLTPDQYAPVPVVVVGLLEGEAWLAITSYEFVRMNFYPPLDNLLIFAKDPRDQPALDRWLRDTLKGERARVWTYGELVEETHKAFRNLYLITGIVVTVISIMLAIMMGLLANIYFQQRLVEFGLLQAVGYTRRALLKRVTSETVIVVMLGWFVGAIATYGALWVMKLYLMEPRGLYLEPLDWIAYQYSLPVPLAVMVFALLTIGWRLRTFDPVAIVERRIV